MNVETVVIADLLAEASAWRSSDHFCRLRWLLPLRDLRSPGGH
jgi:hypothetical protein